MRILFFLACLGWAGCGGDDGPSGGGDAGGGVDAGTGTDSGGGMACESDDDCDDGTFCNGAEACTGARCAPGIAPDCDDGMACTADTCDESARECAHDAEDEDGDSHSPTSCGGDDCDDADPLRHVGATEICDPADRDEDCDSTTFGVRDADMDSYPDAACCNESTCGTDCDDTISAVHPSAPELCSNTIDDDCDGMINEDCACMDGETRPCPDAMGECMSGVQTCAGGAWSSCSVTPVMEVCDGRDEDCNGTPDNGTTIDCWVDGDDDGYAAGSAMRVDACATSAGADRCGDGLTSREPIGMAIDCDDADRERHPTVAEVCDGVDQDCDGMTDEGVRLTVYTDSDGDMHGDPATGRLGCPGPGMVLTSDDCNDQYDTVQPGQSMFFDAGYCAIRSRECMGPTGPGCSQMVGMLVYCNESARSFDYDCDGSAEVEPPTFVPCGGSCVTRCTGGGLRYPSGMTCGGAAERVNCSCRPMTGCAGTTIATTTRCH